MLHISKGISPDNCQNLQCNPILLTIDNPAILAQDPELVPWVYGLGTNVSERNLSGWLALRLVPDATSSSSVFGATTTPDGSSGPLKNDAKRVEIIEVIDLRQTLEIETGYGIWTPGLYGSKHSGFIYTKARMHGKMRPVRVCLCSFSFCEDQTPEQSPLSL
jgi:hypothetical protein